MALYENKIYTVGGLVYLGRESSGHQLSGMPNIQVLNGLAELSSFRFIPPDCGLFKTS